MSGERKKGRELGYWLSSFCYSKYKYKSAKRQIAIFRFNISVMQAERGINRANFSATAVGKKFARGALRQSIFTKWQGRTQASICLS